MSLTITLREPLTVHRTSGSETLTTLTLRRPKVKDLKGMAAVPGTDADREIWLMGTLSGVVPEDLAELDAEDYVAFQDFIGSCLRPRPSTPAGVT